MSYGSCPIAIQARKRPQSLAIVTEKGALTYKQLDTQVAKMAFALEKQNIKRENIVAFPAKKSIETIAFFFALFRCGMRAAPLHPKLPEKAKALCLEDLGTSYYIDPEKLSLSLSKKEDTLDFSKTATLLFTSGSSGKSKIVCHSIANHYYSSLGLSSSISLEEGMRWLLSLPLFHVSGLSIVFRCFFHGLSLVLTEEKLETTLAKYSLSHLSLVPMQLWRLLQKKADLSSLKAILLGGGPISSPLADQASDLRNIFPTYGLTETASLVTLDTNPQITPRGVSLGAPIAFRKLQIVEGEIHVGGEVLFQGYYDTDSKEVLPPGDFFATKDLGRLENGKLFFLGRKDNMFVSGGENIQPEEIENELYKIPSVSSAFVVPISDPEFGERPVAFIHEENSFSEELYIKTLREVFPGYKIPIQFHPIPKHLQELGIKIPRSLLKSFAKSLARS